LGLEKNRTGGLTDFRGGGGKKPAGTTQCPQKGQARRGGKFQRGSLREKLEQKGGAGVGKRSVDNRGGESRKGRGLEKTSRAIKLIWDLVGEGLQLDTQTGEKMEWREITN